MNDVAILIPVYDNQRGLERTLDSISRSKRAADVVVVDDGTPVPIASPDRLRADVPLTLLRLEPNQGIARALNRGLKHILENGYKYVARLDSADTISSERIGAQASFLEENAECGVVGSFVDFVGSEHRVAFSFRPPSEHKRIVRRLRLNNCIIHSASMIRVSALEQVGLYREDVPGAEDYDLFLRIARQHRFAILPRPLTQCSYGLKGISIAGRRRQQRTRLRLQLEYFDPKSLFSIIGVARTLLAMLLPHSAVYQLKRSYLK